MATEERMQLYLSTCSSQPETRNILVTGVSGVGKTSLIRSLLPALIQQPGNQLQNQNISTVSTEQVQSHNTVIGNNNITFWDTPGLQNESQQMERKYLAEMKDACSNYDVILFCIRCDGTSRNVNKDKVAMKELTEYFTQDIWRNAIIVLTFANNLEHIRPEWDEYQIHSKFDTEIEEWRSSMKQVLNEIKVPKDIASKVDIFPAGHCTQPNLPNGDKWMDILESKLIDKIQNTSFKTLPSRRCWSCPFNCVLV